MDRVYSYQQIMLEDITKLQEICQFAIQREHRDVMLIDLTTGRVDPYFIQGVTDLEKTRNNYLDIYREMMETILEEDRERVADELALGRLGVTLLEKGGENTITFRYRGEDGQVGWAEVKTVFFRNDPKCVLFLSSGITERVRKEQEYQIELEAALEQAKKASVAEQKFLTNMSHEIRTPLNGIKGLLNLLAEREELKDDSLLANAIISANHLSALINDVLDMAKINSGKVELQRNLASWEQFYSEVKAIIMPMAEEKGIDLQIYKEGRTFDYIYVDLKRLEQIVINILSNGVKYTPPGGRVVCRVVATPSEQWENRADIEFCIEDNGVGMDEEMVHRVFHEFEQGDNSDSRNGTGLGLAIARNLVDLMDGQITMESQLGVGTTVRINLQVEGIQKEEYPEPIWKRMRGVGLSPNIHFAGKRILLAEDNEINRQIVELQLQSMGIQVDSVVNGEEAVEVFKSSYVGNYDLILMDIMMPKMSGYEAARVIRELPRPDAGAIPILALTANAFVEDVQRSRESGMNYHLSKPIDKEALLEALLYFIEPEED